MVRPLSVLAVEWGRVVFGFWNLTLLWGFPLFGPRPQTLGNTPVLPLKVQRGPWAPCRHRLRACCWLWPVCSVLCASLFCCQAAAQRRAPHATRCWRWTSQDCLASQDRGCHRSTASGSSSNRDSGSSSISKQLLEGGRPPSTGTAGRSGNPVPPLTLPSTGKSSSKGSWGRSLDPCHQRDVVETTARLWGHTDLSSDAGSAPG